MATITITGIIYVKIHPKRKNNFLLLKIASMYHLATEQVKMSYSVAATNNSYWSNMVGSWPQEGVRGVAGRRWGGTGGRGGTLSHSSQIVPAWIKPCAQMTPQAKVTRLLIFLILDKLKSWSIEVLRNNVWNVCGSNVDVLVLHYH